jgi:hypothetical protein
MGAMVAGVAPERELAKEQNVTTRERKELAQLRADVAQLARLVYPHVHPKDGLAAIIERHNPAGVETRPAAEAPERRAKAAV